MNSLNKSLITLFFLIIVSFSTAAQDSYKLSFQIKGLSDTTVYLGYYYGESTYIKDTAKIDLKGNFVFENNKELPKGVYFLVLKSTKIFELLIGENKEFKMVTDTASYIENMQVFDDLENSLFFKNIIYTSNLNRRAQPLVQQLNDSLSSEQDKTSAREQLNSISEELRIYHSKIIEENSGSTIATILKAQMKVEVPESFTDEREKFNYYRNHYWDNFNLGDETLLRMPEGMYRKKIEAYMDNLHMQHPDSLIKGIERISELAAVNQETYKYAIWNLCIKYQTPKIMGQDEVFIYMYDTYFASGKMDYWANESLKKNLKEHADQLRKSLVGSVAPNMIMLNDKLQKVSMYDIQKKYTILYFFDPDCGHCKKETPKLRDFYSTTKHDVEVFAVSADTSMVKMKNYIKDLGLTWISANGPRTITPHYQTLYDANTTPTIYVLDDKKKIIAKKLEAERLEGFLDNYEKYNK